MKFRTIITSIAIAVATVSVCAQKPMTAHEKAHQIAKVSKMDGNTLSNMVSTDVNAREAANAISSKTSSMIDDVLLEIALAALKAPALSTAPVTQALSTNNSVTTYHRVLASSTLRANRWPVKTLEKVIWCFLLQGRAARMLVTLA